MDKIILDEMQLLQLKRFIRIEEGIKEADVVDEILDHLACKTEEVMNQDIFLSFEKAVQAAYYSFGYGGLKLMAKQYEKKMKRLAWKEFKHALPIVMHTKRIIWYCAIYLVLFATTVFIKSTSFDDSVDEIMTFILLFTSLSFYGIQFYRSFISKNDLADYAFDKNILMWQKKVVRMPRIDSIFLLFIFAMPLLKLNAHYYLLIFTTMSFLSLVNSFAKEETMKRMKLKLGKAA